MIALIVAYGKNRVIGYHGKIPWRIEGEQRRFKELTIGNVVVMGRRTFEEIGYPLPGRFTIVVSKNRNYNQENCITENTLEKALEAAGDRDVFISGGEKLYREAIGIVDKMFITEVELEINGDTYFPDFQEEDFEKEVIKHVDGKIPYTYITYTKK